MNKIHFTKMHGCGNDYVYVDAIQNPVMRNLSTEALSALSVKWSDRHKSIGSDGLVLIDRSPVPEADFSMRIFNADGSEAMMCGNASRCIGKFLYERGLIAKTEIRLLTLSGIKTLILDVRDAIVTSVTVDMGEPVLEDESLFLTSQGLKDNMGTFVSMGNPHYVIFTDNVDQVGETGRNLERHSAFPQRCNIEFAAPLSSTQRDTHVQQLKDQTVSHSSEGSFRVRVWERGSGITQACGTGACATAVAAALTGRAGRKSRIIMDGGMLNIEWRESDNHVYMTGPAEFVFDGEIGLM